MAKPEQKFRAGLISATVWNNEKDGKEFKTVSFEKNYKDKEGEWKTTNSLSANDIPRALVVLSKAFEFVTLKPTEEAVA